MGKLYDDTVEFMRSRKGSGLMEIRWKKEIQIALKENSWHYGLLQGPIGRSVEDGGWSELDMEYLRSQGFTITIGTMETYDYEDDVEGTCPCYQIDLNIL